MPIDLGHTHVTLRLPDTPIAPEQSLPQFPWHTVATTAVLVALVVAAALGSSWLEARDTSQYLKSLPGSLLIFLMVIGIWSGGWAVANKVFAGHLQFWRHVRIASIAYVVADVLQVANHLAAFAFSWEALSRFATVLLVLVMAGGVYAHLAAVLPRRRAGLAWTVVAVAVLGVPSWLGVQWLNRMRLSNELYMSSIFPPSLRVAPAVPVEQFLQEAQTLRGQLDRRLRDDGFAGDDDADAENDGS